VLLVRSLSVVFRGGVGSVSTPCLLPHAPIVDEACGGEFGREALGGVVVGDVNECFKLCYHYFTALRGTAISNNQLSRRRRGASASRARSATQNQRLPGNPSTATESQLGRSTRGPVLCWACFRRRHARRAASKHELPHQSRHQGNTGVLSRDLVCAYTRERDPRARVGI